MVSAVCMLGSLSSLYANVCDLLTSDDNVLLNRPSSACTLHFSLRTRYYHALLRHQDSNNNVREFWSDVMATVETLPTYGTLYKV